MRSVTAMRWGKRTPTERWWLCGAGRETTSWFSSTQRALRLYEERSIEVSGAHALNEVGWYTAKLGDDKQAHEICTDALTRCQRTQNPSGEAGARVSLSHIAGWSGQHVEAVEHLDLALGMYGALGDTRHKPTCSCNWMLCMNPRTRRRPSRAGSVRSRSTASRGARRRSPA